MRMKMMENEDIRLDRDKWTPEIFEREKKKWEEQWQKELIEEFSIPFRIEGNDTAITISLVGANEST
jgi:hypothetical protein